MRDPALTAGARADKMVVLAPNDPIAVRREEVAQFGDFVVGGAFGEDVFDLVGGGIGGHDGGLLGLGGDERAVLLVGGVN